MKRIPAVRALALALTLGASLALPAAAHAQTAPGCAFVWGFKMLHDAIPNIVGGCLENEVDADAVHSQQHTTNGLLVWQGTSDGPRFTDGYHTWLNSPNGIQSRLNTDRFPWEQAAPPPAPAPAPAFVAAPVVDYSGYCFLWARQQAEAELAPHGSNLVASSVPFDIGPLVDECVSSMRAGLTPPAPAPVPAAPPPSDYTVTVNGQTYTCHVWTSTSTTCSG